MNLNLTNFSEHELIVLTSMYAPLRELLLDMLYAVRRDRWDPPPRRLQRRALGRRRAVLAWAHSAHPTVPPTEETDA